MNRLKWMPVLLLGVAVGPLQESASGQTRREKTGFNLFSVEQDVEIGKKSATEAERELPLLRNKEVDRYLNRIVSRLSAAAPGARYPYQIKAVNSSEINAFALPGGPMYVNRGLLEATRSEAELAGVVAHEMAHIAMRHGTHEASKAFLARSGLGILGGLFGRSSSTTKMLNTVGGFGLNTVFLKYSRDDEYQADRVGAEMMVKAGYSPLAMATFFEYLKNEQGRNPSKLERFFSSHPAPADREERIREIATSAPKGNTQLVGGYTTMKSTLKRSSTSGAQQTALIEGVDETAMGTATIGHIPVPSTRFEEFVQPTGFFTVDFPSNWNTYPSGFAVSMAPEGGVATTTTGKEVLLYGVIVNHYAPFTGDESRRARSLAKSYAPFEDRTAPRGTLEEATDDLISTIIEANPYLTVEDSLAMPEEMIDGEPGFSIRLSGISPVTGKQERVKIYTRALTDGHVLYALGVAPGDRFDELEVVFSRMMRTLQVDDRAAHRTTTNTSGRTR